MSVGEALVHGLLGGTAAASEHYVSDWRDRVKRKRDQAAEKEKWQYLTRERENEQQYTSEEAEKERRFQERLSDKALEDSKTLYQAQKEIDEQYRDKGTLYTTTDDNQVVEITPGSEPFSPPIAQRLDGQWNYFGSGKGGRGLLSGTGKGSGKDGDNYENIKTPGGLGGTVERTQYTDPDTGSKYIYVVNPNTGLEELIPLEQRTEAPTIVTPEKIAEAEQFADKTIDDIAGWFSSDANDFSNWGGSREAARQFFKQNYLNGTVLDEQGKLRLPGSSHESAPASAQETPRENKTIKAQEMYQSLSPERQDILRQALTALQEGRNAQTVQQRLLDSGFTTDQLEVLF
ncbi:MAG: hypothetical protein LPD71_00220 [Shewanella sp.]|nr:hypothetical protein [Shewanella sp.]MCF1459505.1 hypothetical protein [Shewanella sp.]